MSGLANRNSNIVRARPLQASTNIIHTKIPRRINNNSQQIGDGPLKPAQQANERPSRLNQQQGRDTLKKSSTKAIQRTRSDENDVSSFIPSQEADKPTPVVEQKEENDINSLIKNAYNALTDVHPFDEELYQKVLNLDLADDGLPSYETDEPFDF